MPAEPPNTSDPIGPGHPDWFRPPTRRERIIAGLLFPFFGIFFLLLFVVSNGWWFRWVILAIALYSIYRGLRHLQLALRMPGKS
jgi:hypothetical protein